MTALAPAPYLFSKDNAVEMAKRSWAPTSARFKKPVPIAPQTQIASGLATEQPRAERVRAKLEALLTDMEETDDAKELDALSRAYDRLFRAWMVLSGTPGSGQRKPPPMPRARAQASSGPVVEMLPDAQPNPPAVPVGPASHECTG